MKVFISWSGSISRQIAKSFYDWLPNVLQNVEPFISSEDIEKGSRWLSRMTTELQDCYFGLVCLTPDNLTAPWIHFEAGSLSKMIDRSRLVPILFRLEPSDVQGPLTQFQMVNFGYDEMYRLLQSINNTSEERKLEENRLENIFTKFWPELESSIGNIEFIPTERSQPGLPESKEVLRPILEEILVLSRQLAATADDRLTIFRNVLEAEDVNRLGREWGRFTRVWNDFIEELKQANAPNEGEIFVPKEEFFMLERQVAKLGNLIHRLSAGTTKE